MQSLFDEESGSDSEPEPPDDPDTDEEADGMDLDPAAGDEEADPEGEGDGPCGYLPATVQYRYTCRAPGSRRRQPRPLPDDWPHPQAEGYQAFLRAFMRGSAAAAPGHDWTSELGSYKMAPQCKASVRCPSMRCVRAIRAGFDGSQPVFCCSLGLPEQRVGAFPIVAWLCGREWGFCVACTLGLHLGPPVTAPAVSRVVHRSGACVPIASDDTERESPRISQWHRDVWHTQRHSRRFPHRMCASALVLRSASPKPKPKAMPRDAVDDKRWYIKPPLLHRAPAA